MEALLALGGWYLLGVLSIIWCISAWCRLHARGWGYYEDIELTLGKLIMYTLLACFGPVVACFAIIMEIDERQSIDNFCEKLRKPLFTFSCQPKE